MTISRPLKMRQMKTAERVMTSDLRKRKRRMKTFLMKRSNSFFNSRLKMSS